MCGIAGFAGLEPRHDLGPRLERMRCLVAHRGPDDHGAWASPSGLAAFVHTRLSILDPSPAGHQPMSIEGGRFTITFNGEIYNFAALRETLRQSGMTFRSNSDTEVILRLYQAHGTECFEKLRGMFAIAIWDEQERTCVLARDRFGIKPLFYAHSGAALVFASEVRAIAAGGLVPITIDPRAVFGYFRTGSVPEPRTMFSGVCALAPGHVMTWRAGQASTESYWELSFTGAAIDDPVGATRRALLDSVEHHFVSDVPVGVFLSGGIDSTAIVALARERRCDDLRTFSLAFPGSADDEGTAARRTAAHFKTCHVEWPIDAATGRRLMDDYVTAADQPSIDGLNSYSVSRLARDHDTKVVLSGLGSDELFGGYPSFARVPKMLRWARRAQSASAISRPLIAAGRLAVGSKAGRLGDLLDAPLDLGNAYSVFRGIFTRAEAARLTAHYTGAAVDGVDETHPGPADPTEGDTVSRLELTRYMRNQLLRDCDVMSMASGVEVRVPFLDSVVVDTLSRIPSAVRHAKGKALLLAAVPEIPEWVASAPKRGFMFPIQQWIDQGWSGEMASRLESQGVSMDTWYRKWSLFALERWLSHVEELRHD